MEKQRQAERGSRWALEILAYDGKCRAYLIHQGYGRQVMVWRQLEWQLPDVPITERLVLEELMDAALVMAQQLA